MNEHPCTYLEETLADIERLTALERDWNDEDAPPIDRMSILQAKTFVQSLARVTVEQKPVKDCAPAVFPTIDGGVKLFWQANGWQLALIFHLKQGHIEIVEKSRGAKASRRPVPENEAVDVAMEVIGEVNRSRFRV